MASEKILKINSDLQRVQYMNWLAQIANMLQTKDLFAIIGRGGAKTTDILAPRTMNMAYELAGAPVALISDTYTNLQRNIIKALVESLTMKGWKEGVHFVVGKEPPKHFKSPKHAVISWKHTIAYYTGTVDHALSLDRASIGAGNSYVAVKGDEAKYLAPDKVFNLTKAIRGYREYAKSPYYRGMTFTTDMPDISKIGQYDWILSMCKNMDKEKVKIILNAAFEINKINIRYYHAIQEGDSIKIKNAKLLMNLWQKRYNKVRFDSTFFIIATSFINIDILSIDYFIDEFNKSIDNLGASLFSIEPRLTSGDRFYANLTEDNFFVDGNDSYYAEEFGINDIEDCRILRYLKKDKPLEMGLDVGKINSLTIAQDNKDIYRILKFMYKLKPFGLKELADDVIRYFSQHQNKTLYLWYDRAANKYNSNSNISDAQYFKKCIEYKDGVSTGWNVILQSLNQGNIESNLEYKFMEQLLSEHNKSMPKIRIDMFNCKALKSSLELARTKVEFFKGSSRIVKDKSSEKLPVDRLAYESTNPSDSCKYLLCRREFLKLMDGKKIIDVGNIDSY